MLNGEPASSRFGHFQAVNLFVAEDCSDCSQCLGMEFPGWEDANLLKAG
jgi:hypothetical protein